MIIIIIIITISSVQIAITYLHVNNYVIVMRVNV